VRLVIADTSPINYLLLIGHIDILPVLFGIVILPSTVRDELGHPKAHLWFGIGWPRRRLGRMCAEPQ
jgi:predicted nucleic acid-binding protein